MPDQPVVHVRCKGDSGAWICIVTVGDDPWSTAHRVTLTDDDLRRFAPPGSTAGQLVEASFVFLLEREPRESILPEFSLPVINRYFPEYEREIRRRLTP